MRYAKIKLAYSIIGITIPYMEEKAAKGILLEAVYKLVCALARLLFRYGISSQEFFEVSKKAFVDVARVEFGIRGRPTNKSRIAALTGLSRKEVARLLQVKWPDDIRQSSSNRAMRVVSAWLRDSRYTHDGEPMDLLLVGDRPSFAALVKDHSGDIPPKAMLRDLLRLKVVEQRGEKVHLLQHGFIPAGDDIESLPILGTDVAALIGTISHNLQAASEDRFFQRKASFTSVSSEGIEVLQAMVREQGQRLLEDIDAVLAEYHCDVDERHHEGHFAGLGMYVFVDGELASSEA